jgi:hypothetical protein
MKKRTVIRLCAIFGIALLGFGFSGMYSTADAAVQPRLKVKGITLRGQNATLKQKGRRAVRVQDKLRVYKKLIVDRNIKMRAGRKIDGVDVSALGQTVDALVTTVAALQSASELPTDCSDGQILGFNGTEWECTSDTTATAGTGLTESGATLSVKENLTIDGGTVDDTPIGGTTASTGNFTNMLMNDEARLAPQLDSIPRAAVTTTIDDSSTQVGNGISVTIGTDGFPVMSYVDVNDRKLTVAKCLNEACTSSTVTEVADAGLESSIAIAPNGYPVIAFDRFDSSSEGLGLLVCGNAACTSGNTETAITSSGWASYMEVIINTDGNPFVAYVDSDNDQLKTVACGNAACTSGNTETTVDSSGNVDRTSIGLTLGQDGLAAIAYHEDSGDDLEFIHCSNTACSSSTPQTLDSTGIVGRHVSMTIGNYGMPVMSYYDQTNTSLKLGLCLNVGCSSFQGLTVENDGAVGEYSSIAIDAEGYPIISYYDTDTESNLHIGYLKCTNYDCSNNFHTTVADLGTDTETNTNPSAIALGRNGLPFIAYSYQADLDLRTMMLPNIFGVDYLAR